MTSLAQTALDFCRECLRWEGAAGTHDITTVFEHLRDEPSAALHFTDLNAVMDAVRKWGDENHQNLDIHYVPAPTMLWHVSAGIDESVSADLAHALLAACVDASRTLKATH